MGEGPKAHEAPVYATGKGKGETERVGESKWKGEGNRAKPKNHQPKKEVSWPSSFQTGKISKDSGNGKYFNLQQLSEVNTMTEFAEVLQSA